jgi:hypothetical protein
MTCRFETGGLSDTHFEGNLSVTARKYGQGSFCQVDKGPLDNTVYVSVVHKLQAASRALSLFHTFIGNAVNAFPTLVVWRFAK